MHRTISTKVWFLRSATPFCKFMIYALFFEKNGKLVIYVFLTIVCTQRFDFSASLIFDEVHILFELFYDFAFLF